MTKHITSPRLVKSAKTNLPYPSRDSTDCSETTPATLLSDADSLLDKSMSTSDAWEDFWFVVRYIPEMATHTFVYTALGAVIGYGASSYYSDELKRFAHEHHEAVDPSHKYVPDEEEFMHFTRSMNNRVTPSVNKALPFYSTALGAGAGFFFGVMKEYQKCSAALAEAKEIRAAAKVPV